MSKKTKKQAIQEDPNVFWMIRKKARNYTLVAVLVSIILG